MRLFMTGALDNIVKEQMPAGLFRQGGWIPVAEK